MNTQAMQLAMVVVAHPDDAEFMAAGTIARWTQDGCRVVYVLCTSGDKGSADISASPARLAELRQHEQQRAAATLGVHEVVFLGHEDGVLQNSIDLRRDIVRQIRRFKPDAVICQDPTMRWFGQQYLNHPDHRAAGDACLDAVYPSARDPHVFSELLAEGLYPHKVREVYLSGSLHADMWVDITPTIERKIAALLEHKSQMGEDAEQSLDFVRVMAREAAQQARANGHQVEGMEYAEAFKYFKLD